MYRVVIALLSLAAAGALAYAAFSERWLENTRTPSRRVEFSLLSSKRCVVESANTTCESKSHGELMTELTMQKSEDASRAFVTAGQATLGLSLLSALMLLLCTGWLVARKRTSGNGPQHLALVALMLAMIAATVFVKTKPGGATGVGAGPGFYVFIVACVVGIFAAQLASKLIRPIESEPTF